MLKKKSLIITAILLMISSILYISAASEYRNGYVSVVASYCNLMGTPAIEVVPGYFNEVEMANTVADNIDQTMEMSLEYMRDYLVADALGDPRAPYILESGLRYVQINATAMENYAWKALAASPENETAKTIATGWMETAKAIREFSQCAANKQLTTLYIEDYPQVTEAAQTIRNGSIAVTFRLYAFGFTFILALVSVVMHTLDYLSTLLSEQIQRRKRRVSTVQGDAMTGLPF